MATALLLTGVGAAASLGAGALGLAGGFQQADAIEAAADFNAEATRRNAEARAKDFAFQESVSRFNAADARQQTERQLEVQRTQTSTALASRTAALKRQGLEDVDDIIASDTYLAELEETEILFQGAQKEFEATTQSERFRSQVGAARLQGNTQASIIKASGKNQARSARLGGIGAGLGGVASFTNQFRF